MNRLNTNKALHYALLCIAVLLSSCVNTLELVAPQGEGRVMSHEVAAEAHRPKRINWTLRNLQTRFSKTHFRHPTPCDFTLC